MKKISVLYNQDVFDLVNKIGYGLDNVYKFIGENTFIDSVDFDFNANPGRSIEYDETFKGLNAQILSQSLGATINDSRNITTKENQTIFDLALMTVGIDNLINLLNENNISIIDKEIKAGKVFNFSIKDVKDRGFYNRQLNITTGDLFRDQYLLEEDGGFLLQENGEKIILEF